MRMGPMRVCQHQSNSLFIRSLQPSLQKQCTCPYAKEKCEQAPRHLFHPLKSIPKEANETRSEDKWLTDFRNSLSPGR